MPLNIHAFVQDADYFDGTWLRAKHDDVGGRREFEAALADIVDVAAKAWLVCKQFHCFSERQEISLRLFNAPMLDGVFPNFIKIAAGFGS